MTKTSSSFDRRRGRVVHLLAATAGTLALTLGAGPAAAEPVPQLLAAADPADSVPEPAAATAGDPSSPGGGGGEITVTGSRIVRDGYSAPTPVTVLGAAELRAQAPANIADIVNQLPSIAGSNTAGTTSGALSPGSAGISSLSLRGLGAGRTLVLLDGQRSVASSVGGTVDINTFPQDLIERVEVVTGGASAAYGSDAVGGVVNFILDKKFSGLKATLEQGITTYGDAPNYRASMTAGTSLLGDRLHILLNGEYFHQTGVGTIARDWNGSGFFQINNPLYTPTNGLPQRYVGSGIGPSGYTAGGLVSTGPLRGTYFGANGVTGQLNYGTTLSPWMIGGDYRTTLAGHIGTNSLVPTEERISLFNRTAFDLTPDIQIYGQVSWNRYEGQSFYQQTPSTGVVIQRDNAFLNKYYPAVAGQLTTLGLPSIIIGTSNAGFLPAGSDNKRNVYRYVAGANGSFDLLGDHFRWDAYYQHGVVKAHEQLNNTWNNGRMALAQDAVFAPVGNAAGLAAGSIVCRSTLTNSANGCVPIDRLGTSGPSAAALGYIYGSRPTRDETIKEDVAAATISGQIFQLPGGMAAIAFGGEWRREAIDGAVDPQFNSGWLYGNFLVNRGKYNVKEGFVEIDLPVLRGVDINAAGRYTDYSTSGAVQTWKIGGTYQPIDDLKVRGTYSRDIRAPNLQELFAAGTARTNTVIIPTGASAPATGSLQFVQSQVGNSALKPEVAKTWTVGAVITPRFLPGFSASFDYYDINIRKAIGNVTAQDTVDLCYSENVTSYCPNIVFAGNVLQTIFLKPINFANQHEKGLDIEASYRFDLDAISAKLPGSFSVHSEITHYISNVVNNGISFPIDYAGVNGGSLSGTYSSPSWVYRVSAFYQLDPVTFNLVARGFGSGVYGNDYVQCTSGCPVATPQHRTINDNRIAGITYFDASMNFKIKAGNSDADLTLVVNNMFDKDPVLIGNGPDGNNVPAYAQTNRQIYDVLGRTFRISVRVKI